jgi:hypothetical protein
MSTDMAFIAMFVKIAISVDIPSSTAMKKGPASLQIRSIRRIWELSSVATLERRRNHIGREDKDEDLTLTS